MTADVTQLSLRFQQLVQDRAPMDAAWRLLAEHFLPMRYTSMHEDLRGSSKDMLLNDKIVDATGIQAMRTLAAGLHGGMTSPARPWFRLGLDNDELANSHNVRGFLDEVAKLMRVMFHRSNFYNSIHTLYGDLGTFGTGYIFEFADYKSGLRFVTVPAGQYVIDVSATGRVDTVYRRMQMTTRQMVQEFGYNACPKLVQDACDSKRPDRIGGSFDVIHAVYPRSDRDVNAKNQQHMPWASVYWLDTAAGRASRSQSLGGGKPHVLREGGFENFPGFGPRWDSMPGSAYGRSPAMDCLPDCRMLQQMGITTLKAVHKAVDPPMGVSSSLKSVGLDLTPGGLNYVENMPGSPPQAATPLLQIRPEIQAARMMIDAYQRQVQQGLYNDLFRMLLASDRSQITAREVAAKEEEKLILIGPVLERLQDELFNPLIDRTFDIMTRFNMLPPIPQELQGQDIKVEFVSLLAQAQKLVSTSAVDQLLAFTMNAAQAFPEALDAIDMDNVMDGYAEYLGTEVDMLRPRDDREVMRQQRAQAQQQAQQMAALQQGAGIVNDIGGAMQGEGGAMDALLGGLGQVSA